MEFKKVIQERYSCRRYIIPAAVILTNRLRKKNWMRY